MEKYNKEKGLQDFYFRGPSVPVQGGGADKIDKQEPERIETLEALTRFSTSSNVRIRYHKVQYLPRPYSPPSDKWIDAHVIPSAGRDLALVTGLYVDPILFGHGYRFRVNYRTIQVRTNRVQNNYTDGKVDDLNWGSWFWMSKTWRDAQDAVPGKRGLYIFEPYVIIDTCKDWGDGYYQGQGTSEFAFADPYYFFIEALPEA
jgi:hypothetical protein